MTEKNVFEHKYKTVQIGCKISNHLSSAESLSSSSFKKAFAFEHKEP